MKFDIIKFLEDNNIPYATKGVNTAKGWINTNCPLCIQGDESNHLGFNIKNSYWKCWRCGHHWPETVIMELIATSFPEAKRIIREYSNNLLQQPEKKENRKIENLILPLPGWTMKMRHHEYLIKREFDSEKLEKEYDLSGTDHIGEYKFRIIIPIYFNGKLISYQGRDITERQTPKYKACKKELELLHHKYILYNIDNAEKNTVVVVEGIMDVFRLGSNSVATFGTGFTPEQVNLLADRFKKIIIFYDKGEEAQQQAMKLSTMLNGLGRESEVIEHEQYDDPADMPQNEADYFMKNI
jgi:hypothetical protein